MRLYSTFIILAITGFAGFSWGSAITQQDIQVLSFSQITDHAQPDAFPKFKQKLVFINKFATNSNSPVMLEICGESDDCSTPTLMTLAAAKKFQAFILLVEHRYYGTSIPLPVGNPKNMRFLSTDQALKDLATVIQDLQRQLVGPWIALGSSYSGNLAAYLRTLYPSLVVGAVAVSAPVKAQATWPEMDTFISQSLGPECGQDVKLNLDKVEKYVHTLSAEGLRQFRSRIGLKVTQSPAGITELSYDLVRWLVSIGKRDEFCQSLSNDDGESFLRYFQWYASSEDGMNADSFSVEAPISQGAGRSWFYQTCSEYGYFQIHHPNSKTSPSFLTPDFYKSYCKKYFGIDSLPNADAFNSTHYAKILSSGSNILFVNAQDDPWSMLSITPGNNANENLSTVMVKSGGHCQAANDFDQAGNAKGTAGTRVLKAIQSWIKK